MSDEWRTNTVCPLCKRVLVTEMEKYTNECGICTIEKITGKPFIPFDDNNEDLKEDEGKHDTRNGNTNLNSFGGDSNAGRL